MIKRALIILLIIALFELVSGKLIASTIGVEDFSFIRDVLVPMYQTFKEFVRWVVT